MGAELAREVNLGATPPRLPSATCWFSASSLFRTIVMFENIETSEQLLGTLRTWNNCVFSYIFMSCVHIYNCLLDN